MWLSSLLPVTFLPVNSTGCNVNVQKAKVFPVSTLQKLVCLNIILLCYLNYSGYGAIIKNGNIFILAASRARGAIT